MSSLISPDEANSASNNMEEAKVGLYIRIPASLKKYLKQKAAEKESSLQDFVVSALKKVV